MSKQTEAMKLAASVLKGSQEYKRGHTTFVEAVEDLDEALAEQQEPVAKYIGEGSDGSLVQLYDDVKKGTDFYTAPQPAQPQEPVRIYDYVWPQRDEHKEECVYACSYTPGHHLARGELLAVVHPSQLKNAYLQRDGEAAHGIKEKT